MMITLYQNQTEKWIELYYKGKPKRFTNANALINHLCKMSGSISFAIKIEQV